MQTIPLRELSIVFIPTAFLLVIMLPLATQSLGWVARKFPHDTSATIGRLFSNLPLPDHATNCYCCIGGRNDRSLYVDRL